MAFTTTVDACGVLLANKQNWCMVDSGANWQNATKSCMIVIQTAAIAADATSQAFLAANRSFITNNDGADHILNFNGQKYTFTAGKTYCCSSGEFDLFFNQATAKGFNMTAATMATFVAGANGVVAFFAE